MKKIPLDAHLLNGILSKKLLLTMKFSIIIAFVSVIGLSASTGYSQKTRISLELENTSIRKVLKEIKRTSEFSFWYSNTELNDKEKISISATNETIYTILDEVLSGQELSYEIKDRHIVIFKPETVKEPEVQTEMQQQRTIQGVVKSSDTGEPLIGVSVVESGTTNGAVTDSEGKYILELTTENAVIVFSYVGFIGQSVTITNQTALDISLDPDIKNLDEIVVIGYGTAIKKDLTGSISSVDGEDMTEEPTNNFQTALQGRATGVQVMQQGGVPGTGVRVMIRGTNSVSSGTEPLWIVDGIPINQSVTGFSDLNYQNAGVVFNPLADLNPNDIESIDVLKDAAATAIYGSRGANGVILVTTKTGKVGQTAISFNVQVGQTSAINSHKTVSGPEWLSLVDEARANDGLSAGYIPPNWDLADSSRYTRAIAENTNTNWYDKVMQKGKFQEYNLSFSRGTKNASYFISGRYRDEEGLVQGNTQKQYSLRTNIDFRPMKFMKVGVRLNPSYRDSRPPQITYVEPQVSEVGANHRGGRGGYEALYGNALPIYPEEINGEIYNPYGGSNLVYARENLYYQHTSARIVGSAFFDAEILPDLNIHGEIGTDYITFSEYEWISENIRHKVSGDLSQGGSTYGGRQVRRSTVLNTQLYANYSKEFLDEHVLAITAGMEATPSKWYGTTVRAENLIDPYKRIGTPSTDNILFTEDTWEERRFVGYFGRLNYKFKDRYLLGGSIRRDGSSSFTPEDRWGTFPSLSAGWVLSEEAFMDATSKTISFLKLRGSYGMVGNNNIPGGLFFPGYLTFARYGSNGRALRTPAAPLVWERTSNVDFGIDFELLKGRFSGSFGYYSAKNDELILETLTAPSIGLSNPYKAYANVGSMENNGIEISLTANIISTNEFRWTANFNLTTQKNKVTSLTPDLEKSPLSTRYTRQNDNTIWNGTRVGHPLAEYYIAEFAGYDNEGYALIYEVDQTRKEESNGYVTEKTGNTVRATTQNVSDHAIWQEDKNGMPTYFGGFGNNFTYKGFELNILFTFQGGNYIYNNTGRILTAPRANEPRQTYSRDLVGNYWTPGNTGAEYARLDFDGLDPDGGSISNLTDQYLHKGNFVRFRTLSIGYNLPQEIAQKAAMEKIKIYLTMHNLATFSEFKFWDPEYMNLGDVQSDAQDRNMSQGIITRPPLPQVFTISGGINVTF